MTAVGYSLGGNILLKWLGEVGHLGQTSLLRAAVAISVPYQLMEASNRMAKGLSRIYQRFLLKKLHSTARKRDSTSKLPIDIQRLDSLKTFYAFDDQVTAPLHGYSGVEEYYATSSSRPFLKSIETPTLLLHARDDPFMFPETLPGVTDLSSNVELEWSKYGGHVGFISKNKHQRYWLESRVPEWLSKTLGI